MGGGCSRSSSQQAEQGEANPSRKTVGPNNGVTNNVVSPASVGKPAASQPLCRVVGFAVTRPAASNVDVGSKSSSAVLRSNSYWSHQDDDRVDTIINRWKASEVFYLQGLYKEYLQISKPLRPATGKGRNVLPVSTSEGTRLPVEVLLSAMTSKRIFVAGSGTLLGITFAGAHTGPSVPSESTLLSSVMESGGPSSSLTPAPVIMRLRPNKNVTQDTIISMTSPYVCESANSGASASLPSSVNRFAGSLNQATFSQPTSPTKPGTFSQPQRCVPIWGLTARGVYQALCVQTLAIALSPVDSMIKVLVPRTRTFHFHIRKPEYVADVDLKRDRAEEEMYGSGGSLNLDFRDFGRAFAILGGKGSREEMLILLFLLFSEPVPNTETIKESEGSTNPTRLGLSRDYASTLTIVPSGPGSPTYTDTLGVSSSPREISLVLGSPRSMNNGEKEKEEAGEILALTQMGLDCLVRFLIVSQAIHASNDGVDSAVNQAANIILDVESQDIANTETVNAKSRPLYTFAVRTTINANTPRVPLVTFNDAVLPLTLPVFLSMLCVPDENSERVSPSQMFAIDVPGSTVDVSSYLFTTSNLTSSLSVFMEDMGELNVVAAKAIEKEKRIALQQQEIITAAINAKEAEKLLLAATAAQLPRENGKTSADDVVKSPQRRKSIKGTTLLLDDATRAASTSPSGATKHRKSKTNNRVITPSNVVAELVPTSLSTAVTSDAHSSDMPSLSPEEHDSQSIGSAGTGTTMDSLPNVDVARTLGSKTLSTNNMTSPTFSSSILAALSFSSHGHTGQSTSNTQDGAGAIRTRASVNPTVIPPALSKDTAPIFYSSTCGLINLGNTCFMSSALQCLVHSPLVKDYFVSGKYKEHLNTRNPLGTKGVLTEEFAALIESMWRSAQKSRGTAVAGQSSNNLYKKQLRSAQSTPSSSSMHLDITSTAVIAIPAPCFAPHDFKRVLQTCKSQFQGHEQQDVQEFLAEIMDALHEDLNRCTRYTAGHLESNEEAPSNTVAASASMAWKKLTGQNGKRVITLHVANNESASDKDRRDELGRDKKESKKELELVTAASVSSSVTSPVTVPLPAPLSLEDPSVKKEETTPTSTLTLQEQGVIAWQQHLSRNRSCVMDLFQGQLCSSVTCNVCGNVSKTFDPFTSLSLPLPVKHDITVIVTMVRRMPRLSAVALNRALAADTTYSSVANRFLTAQIDASEPIRLVVVMPRLSDMSDLKKAICLALSPPAPKVPSSSSSGSGSSPTPLDKSFKGATTVPYTLLPDNIALLDCYQEGGLIRNVLEDRESILQLIDSISRSTTAAATAGANSSQRSATGVDTQIGSGLVTEGPPSRVGSARFRSDSINFNAPSPAPTHSKADAAAAIQESSNGGMVLHCVAVENPKNIPFIFSLSSSRLGSRSGCAGLKETSTSTAVSAPPSVSAVDKAATPGQEGTPANKENGKQKTPLPSALDPYAYTDECEYLEGVHASDEGDIVADLDIEVPAGTAAAHVEKEEEREKAPKSSSRKDKEKDKEKDSSAFAKWPLSIEGLVLGRRVDALDHRGQWFAGTIMDRWKVTPDELTQLAVEAVNPITQVGVTMKSRRKSKTEMSLMNSNRNSFSLNRDKDRNRGPKAIGWHLRIHFDNFSGKWDEWYSAADFEFGKVARVYTYSTRRLKVVDVIVVQRQITLRNSTVTPTGSPASHEAGAPKVLNVKVFGYPIVLQCESFRSCEHVHRIIAEQSIRYAQHGQMRNMVESSLNRACAIKAAHEAGCYNAQPVCDQTRPPFTIRIISTNSALASESLEGLEVDLGLVDKDEGRASPSVSLRESSNKSPLLNKRRWSGIYNEPYYNNVMDRANGFQMWEGSLFPRDPVRPLCNLVHSRLLVAVDWHWNNTIAPTSRQCRGMIALRDHESLGKHMATLIPPLPAPAVPLPLPVKKDMPIEGAGIAERKSLSPVPSTSSLQLPMYTDAKSPTPAPVVIPNNINPTLEDCLKSFTGAEELDENSWHCEKCDKLSSSSVSSSLSRLPDLLIMHIKRFGMTARFREKIRAKVTFPLTSLDMKPFITPSTAADKAKESNDTEIDNNMYLYDLYAVANHLGGMSGGHYTAMVKCDTDLTPIHSIRPANSSISSSAEIARSASNDRHTAVSNEKAEKPEPVWTLFDDDVVTVIPPAALEATIVSESAYVLFYKRRQLTSSNIVNLSP